ncbi:MAG: hypothetical protein O3A00_24635, partial [Planctomycetota bacterium]|nr:hypothetical protein [Planctomycetota bacterium]
MTSRLMRFFRVVFTGTLVLAVLGTAVFVGVRMYLVKSVTADDIRAAAAQSIADGDPGTARLYYLKLIHLDPDDTDARMALVRLSLEPGADPEDADNYATNVEALAQFAEVAARRPKDQSINTLLMSALFKAGRIGDATDVAQCLVDAGHSGDLAFRLLAIRAIDAGELDQAQHWLTKLENQAGDNTMQHALLFLRYHSLRQDRDETRKFLRQILQTFAGGHESSLNELLVQDRDSFFKLIDAAQGFAGQQPPDEPLIDSTLLTLWRIGDAQDAPDRHMLMLQRIARLLLATRTFSSDAGFQERHQQRVARFVGWCKPIKNPPPVVAEQLARAAFTAGDSRRAFDILRSTAARMAVDAKSAELDVESAEQPANSMQSLLRSTPDEQSRFLLFASQHMLAAGRPVDAEALIEQLLKTDGSTGWAYLLRATIALGEDRLADAEHDLKAAEAVMSGDPLIHVPMAQLYLRQARWFDAQQTLELARIGWQSLNESHREWLERVFGGRSGIDLGQAAALLGMGELERASPWLESLKNGPYAVKCERLLIWYYTRQGDIETSRKHIRSARERFPHDVLLMVADATVLREEGQAEAAERVVRLFAEQHPQSLAASMLVAQFLIETNRRDA